MYDENFKKTRQSIQSIRRAIGILLPDETKLLVERHDEIILSLRIRPFWQVYSLMALPQVLLYDDNAFAAARRIFEACSAELQSRRKRDKGAKLEVGILHDLPSQHYCLNIEAVLAINFYTVEDFDEILVSADEIATVLGYANINNTNFNNAVRTVSRYYAGQLTRVFIRAKDVPAVLQKFADDYAYEDEYFRAMFLLMFWNNEKPPTQKPEE